MTFRDKVYLSVMFILIITGWFIADYAGGVVSGFGLAMALAFFVGKSLAKKTIARLDKKVKDIIINERE